MTKSGALISGNKNWNQSTPSFLSLSHLPDIMETSCYDLVGNDIPQPDPYSEIQENYGENLIVATDQKVKAWTFYCDSVEWDDNALWGNTSSEEKRNCLKTVNKSGDGSKENPWRNVNYALQKLECLADRTCCQYFQLIITGKVNYTVYCFSDYYLTPVDSYFENRVILDFSNADMSINRSDIEAIAFYKLRDVYIKNCQELRRKHVITALVTGKGRRSCDISLAYYGFAELFDVVETGSPSGPDKPEGIRRVLKQFRLKEEEAVYVGDAPSDIQSARTAGIPVISAAWASPAEPEVRLSLKPDRIFYSVADFRSYLDSLTHGMK